MTDSFDKLTDTIAAVSTPRGKGGVALIRISGPDCREISRKIFVPAGKTRPESAPRTSVFGRVVFPPGTADAGETADTALAVFYESPRSFTGEDTLEICCHGGVLVSAAVLRTALLAGARQAEAGEFTRRAFAAGKISLDEAESLGLLLDAGTDAQLKLSRAGLSGTLSRECVSLREEITGLLADLYARIDFPEEDLGSIPEEEIKTRLQDLIGRTERLSASWKTGRAIAEGIETVIVGKTNSGKSTLYNAMTGEESAIVTDVAGTTRDVLTSTVSFGGITLRLSDTAGIRASAGDGIERIGIDRALGRLSSAELVLFLIDSASDPGEDGELIARQVADAPGRTVAILSRCDLGPAREFARELWERFPIRTKISSSDPETLSRLAKLVSSLFTDGETDPGRDPVISTARQFTALEECREALEDAAGALGDGFCADVCSVCLEEAAERLSALDGRGAGAVSADVIDTIFSKFCVGK